MKGNGWLYIKAILQVTTRYFFCLLLKKLLTYFCLQQYVPSYDSSIDRLYTIVMFTRESDLMCITFAQFL